MDWIGRSGAFCRFLHGRHCRHVHHPAWGELLPPFTPAPGRRIRCGHPLRGQDRPARYGWWFDPFGRNGSLDHLQRGCDLRLLRGTARQQPGAFIRSHPRLQPCRGRDGSFCQSRYWRSAAGSRTALDRPSLERHSSRNLLSLRRRSHRYQNWPRVGDRLL